MGRNFRWEPDRAAQRALAHSAEVVAELLALRDAAAAEARRLAPVGKTGHYARSIVTGPVELDGGEPTTTYGSTDIAAHLVEFGSAHNPPYRPLTRGAQAVGLEVED